MACKENQNKDRGIENGRHRKNLVFLCISLVGGGKVEGQKNFLFDRKEN